MISSFKAVRDDGVTFIYDKFSPNGTEINALTAHDEHWASVPVGRFMTAQDAIQAIEQFVMPAHTGLFA
jgi:hypothetical protein